MPNKKLLKAIAVSSLGNVFEWYDFMVYAALTPLLAKIFFPGDTPVVSLIYTFGVFAAGFLTRPVGAFLFGYLGDHFGRRKSLLYSIALMAAPTFLIGCLPGHKAIGIAAPLLLILLRLLQGLGMSGEMSGNVVFLVEIAPAKWRTIVSSLAVLGALLGMLLGSNAVLWLTKSFGEQEVLSWLWRIPFWFAAVLGFLVLLMRSQLSETQMFLAEGKPPANPIRLCLVKYWRSLLIGVGCLSIYAAGIYFFVVFALNYFYQMVKVPLNQALLYVVVIQFSIMIALLIGGFLGDRFGRKRVSILFTSIVLLACYPALVFLSKGMYEYNSAIFLMGLVAIAGTYGISAGVIPALESALFPTYVRFTGVSLVHNAAMAIFGGAVPMLMAYLVHVTHDLTSPSWVLIICCLISLISFLCIPKTQEEIK